MTKDVMLQDGEYQCNATLHVKDGKAVVELHTTFGLKPGTKIPLYRKNTNILVETYSGSEVSFLNGHAII